MTAAIDTTRLAEQGDQPEPLFPVEPTFNALSLCTGVGGLDLGFERAGMTTVGQVELSEFCRAVLTKHWPKVPKHDDVRTCVDWWRSEARPGVDLIAAGFPCQPASLAGPRLGENDERWLWPDVDRVIGELRPEWFVFENVPGLRTMGLGAVLADLDRRGYRVRVGEISACAVGFPHPRNRLFGLAHAPRFRRPGRGSAGPGPALLEREGRGQKSGWGWAAGSRPHGVAYGLPSRVDRLRGIGNAVVPAVAEYVGRLILAADLEQAAA